MIYVLLDEKVTTYKTLEEARKQKGKILYEMGRGYLPKHIQNKIDNFIARTEIQQGYVSVKFNAPTWGEIEYRKNATGSPTGTMYFDSLEELENKINNLEAL